MAPHSSTLAGKIPWIEEPGGLQSLGSQSRTQLKRLSSSSSKGNGCPLQYSCLGKSMDRGVCGLQSMVSQELDMTENTHIVVVPPLYSAVLS